MQNKSNIALIYFSRREVSESQHKSWFKKGHNLNRLIASALIHSSYQAIKKSGFPVFHYHEGNQTGSTFGERFANAYEEVFQLGYDAVIAVGNDSPELSSTNWQEVNSQLLKGKCVIGPSIRGGAYLIGITRAAFHKVEFEKLPWQTNRLFQSLVHFCYKKNNDPHFIQILRDINSFLDIKALKNSSLLEYSYIRILLFLISYDSILPVIENIKISLSQLLSIQLLRAPPVT